MASARKAIYRLRDFDDNADPTKFRVMRAIRNTDDSDARLYYTVPAGNPGENPDPVITARISTCISD